MVDCLNDRVGSILQRSVIFAEASKAIIDALRNVVFLENPGFDCGFFHVAERLHGMTSSPDYATLSAKHINLRMCIAEAPSPFFKKSFLSSRKGEIGLGDSALNKCIHLTVHLTTGSKLSQRKKGILFLCGIQGKTIYLSK